MPAEMLEHFTIECGDLKRTRDFYCEIVGLTEGFRPQMAFPGYWLYCAGVPIVHLMKADMADRPNEHCGRLDHIAFKCSDPDYVLGLMRQRGIAYVANLVWEIGTLQVFVRDPDGLQIELNFRGAIETRKATPEILPDGAPIPRPPADPG